MKSYMPFARFTQLMKVVDDLPVPIDVYNRHRSEYDYILGQVSIFESNRKQISIGELSICPILGSQPTATKRIHELVKFNLLKIVISEDRRIKSLLLTEQGTVYMVSCSDLMNKVLSQDLGFQSF